MSNKQITFEQVKEYVKTLRLEDSVALAVLSKARSIPPGSLSHFITNIHTHITNVTRETHDKTE